MTEQSETSFRSLMGLVDLENTRYRTYIDFFYDGTINVFVKGGATGINLEYTETNWEVNTWFNVKIETFGENVKYYIDDELIHEGILLSDEPISLKPLRDVPQRFKLSCCIYHLNLHFYNKESQSLMLESKKHLFNDVSIFDLSGQEVFRKDLSGNSETIDIASLKNGIYIAKIGVGNLIKSLKILKY